MAAIITMNDPFATGVNAADSWAAGQNDAKAKALALARQKMLDDRDQSNADRTYQAGRDDATERTREFGLTDARADKTAAATIAGENARTENQKLVTQQAKVLFPIAQRHAQNQLIQDGDEHTAAKLKATGDSYQNTLSAIAARHGEETARAAAALVQAQIAHENALTSHEFAETAKTRLESQRGPRLTGDDLKSAALQARDALPPVLQTMLEQVEGGQTDRVGLLTWARGNPQYSQYVPMLAKLLTIPGTVGRASAADTRATGAADASARDDTSAMAPKALALKATKLFPQSGIPAEIQDFAIGQLSKGVSIDAIADSIKTAKRSEKNGGGLRYDDATQQNVFKVLRQLDPSALPAPAAAPTNSGGLDFGAILQQFSKLLGPGAAAMGAGANLGNADPSLWAK